MTGVAGSPGPGAGPGWRWDVALSFASAQRGYVEQVAGALRARGVRCFYDADEQVELWGKYLAEELPDIYAEQAAAVVVFISAEYAARDWTRLERRAALNRAVRERREYVLPARFDDTPLPGLLSDMVAVDLQTRTPREFAAMIADKLARLAITAPAPSARAGDPAPEMEPAPPAGAVRAEDVDPRRLGVHAAISVPGVSGEVPPEYVLRDVDVTEHGVRARVAAAAERAGFVLLVGGSSVGKTRSAVEAVKALLPDWWLVHPAGPNQVAALARVPFPRMVVWLDELQRYLDGEHGLTGAVVRALLSAPRPAVIIGTLWPDRYSAYTTLPATVGTDPLAREREVLDLADVIRIGSEFTEAEQDRARAGAARDPRLALALGATGYGLPQILAAAPQLGARWQDAKTASPFAWAVLTAALDVARLGARAPLSADLLRAAVVDYCTSEQQAEAPENWFEQALTYATQKLLGAAAALSPARVGMGQIAGYTAADYLIQHVGRERLYTRVPASTWNAILSYLRDPADAARVADSARNRLLYRYAIPLYRLSADARNRWDAPELDKLLAARGDLDELRTRADAGDGNAVWRLIELLAARGDLDELRARADAGNWFVAGRLAGLLAARGDLDELRARADGGDWFAAWQLAELLAGRGDLDEAAQILRAQADAGDGIAAGRLAELLAGNGDLNGAAQILRARADAGDEAAAKRLPELLAERGDLDGAAQILRARADVGDRDAAWRLAELLAGNGDLNGAAQILRARANADEAFAWQLAELLAARGDLDELRTMAVIGDWSTSRPLADLLAARGDLDELRARADAGDWFAAERLAELLAGRGDLDELRARADAGDWFAAGPLADLLAGQGDLDELRARADAGDGHAAGLLADLLAERGDPRGAAQILRAWAARDEAAAGRLADLLAEVGDLDELRARAVAGDEAAASRLPELLIRQGRIDEAEQLRRFGLNPDGSIASA